MTGSAEKTVMPEDIADKGKKVFGEEETVEGVRVGIHWFEVMKVNKIQLECIKILSKKCDAMQNNMRSHHTDRLKLAVDWAKYPNFEDYKAAIIAVGPEFFIVPQDTFTN
ncbi:hypothetical protein LQV05_005647 [Cryptococcus neoformans]|nr:hypothetical protein LQV05_005647 [Cryptococcus neoformans]